MSMFSTERPPIPQGWKAREQNAKAKRERNAVDPAVREARARLQEERETILDVQNDAARKAKTRPQESFREAMNNVPDDVLTELASYIGHMNPRDMVAMIGEILNQRTRDRLAEAHRKPAESPPAPRASSSTRTR